MKKKSFFALAFTLLFALSVLLMTACSAGEPGEPEPEPEPEPITNPLTGETAEAGFDEDAINRRVVAFVVENTPDARPQWGMDDEQYSPDIILEGEVEGGITRTLWMYADYNKLPEQIGPMRSARPPYIRFSELFDAIFIHWGQSTTENGYIGANTVFKEDGVDHINQMSFADECGMYDRDYSRNVSSEHTGIVYGAKVPDAIAEKDFRTTPEEYTLLQFNKTAEPMSEVRADEVYLDYSTRTDWETTVWTYNEEDQKYHTDNFYNNLTRDNLLILFDQTEYIEKTNYHGTGSSCIYCDYKLAGGTGKLISQGTVKDIEWKVEGGKLILIDVAATKAAQEEAAAAEEEEETANAKKNDKKSDEAEGEEAEEAEPILIEAKLNPGKTWIGWASANNGGHVDIVAYEVEEEEASEGEETEAADAE
ncbi:MAG: DUF3048 domain-containing protein [Mogibacterium sp.]|nr:DUF3048 domain-containing protein [Mogibacterium sp.]